MLQARGLSKVIEDNQVLDRLSLDIADGEQVYLVGQSGQGKTVLGRCLFGLLDPDAGSVRLDGVELVGADQRTRHRLRMRYVYVFQHPTLFDAFTVEENIALPLRYHGQHDARGVQRAVDHWLDEVGVTAFRRAYPSELPFGVQKKVSIARALSLEPKGLILDEPTTGLDREAARELTDSVDQLHQRLGLTSVVISHDRASILRRASRVILIHDARLEEGRLVGGSLANTGDGATMLPRFLGVD